MKKELLSRKISSMVDNTRFGSVEFRRENQFRIKEYEEGGDETIGIVAIENTSNGTVVQTEDDWEIPISELTYRELEQVYKAIKCN